MSSEMNARCRSLIVPGVAFDNSCMCIVQDGLGTACSQTEKTLIMAGKSSMFVTPFLCPALLLYILTSNCKISCSSIVYIRVSHFTSKCFTASTIHYSFFTV